MTQEPERMSESVPAGEPTTPLAASLTNEAANGGSRTPGGKRGDSDKPSAKAIAWEWIETIVIALVIALGVRYWVVQVYLVEGASMQPTLHTGERLFVNKLVYRLREPKPGEIIVLQDPTLAARELIKRVVAVPGERVAVEEGVLYINGKAVREPFITPMDKTESFKEVTVQPGYVFVMGDNRPNSLDSRRIGQIPMDRIDGKAFFLFWPLDRFNKAALDQSR